LEAEEEDEISRKTSEGETGAQVVTIETELFLFLYKTKVLEPAQILYKQKMAHTL
jgi:hypothetical protein